jgi:octaprenyl-diphosphate synthase
MQLLSTTQGVEALRHVNLSALSEAPRFEDVDALVGPSLGAVERALKQATGEGEAPATLAAEHLIASGGKRVRPVTLLLSAACFGALDERARELAAVVEMVHVATLLHDDVIDDSDERRGRVTARRVYGNAVSVLAGDLMLTHALDRTFKVAPSLMGSLLVTLRRLVDGEVLQLRGRVSLDLSASTYDRILMAKTASLFGWAAGAGARLGGADDATVGALTLFGERLGMAFQLVDDVLDYEGDPRQTGKGLLGDLREGKVTLPLALAAADRPAVGDDAARAREGDEAAAVRVAEAVRASGACREARARARAMTDAALAALHHAPASPARALLEQVSVALTRRER